MTDAEVITIEQPLADDECEASPPVRIDEHTDGAADDAGLDDNDLTTKPVTIDLATEAHTPPASLSKAMSHEELVKYSDWCAC